MTNLPLSPPRQARQPSHLSPGNEPLLAARICPRPVGVKAARLLICGGPLAAEQRSYATPLGQLAAQVGVCGRCGHEWLLGPARR